MFADHRLAQGDGSLACSLVLGQTGSREQQLEKGQFDAKIREAEPKSRRSLNT